jgi:hypothetical protein
VKLSTAMAWLTNELVKLAVAMVKLAVAMVRLAVASVKLSTAMVRLATVLVKLAVGLVKLAEAMVKLAVGLVKLAEALVKLAIATHGYMNLPEGLMNGTARIVPRGGERGGEGNAGAQGRGGAKRREETRGSFFLPSFCGSASLRLCVEMMRPAVCPGGYGALAGGNVRKEASSGRRSGAGR